jgi:predicted nucleic acid-binding protein
MAIVCDTGGVYALYDADDSHHLSASQVIQAELGPFFLPVVLLAEIDYLLSARLGADAALDFLQSVEQGAFTLVDFRSDDLARCRELVGQYRDLPLGIADASVVATAERLNIPRLLTVDERHFRAVKPRPFNHFILLPADRQ